MKKFCLIMLLIAFSAPVFAVEYFQGSYADALKKAGSENKNLFLYFTAKWCGPCRYMDDFVFVDEGIGSLVGNYVAMKIDMDTDAGKTLYLKFGVRGVPVFFIITPQEQILKQKVGGMKAQPLSQFLRTPVRESVLAINQAQSIPMASPSREDSAIDKPRPLAPVGTNTTARPRKSDSMDKISFETPNPKGWSPLAKFFMASSMSKWKPGIRLGYSMSNLQNNLAFKSSTISGYYAGLFLDFTSPKQNFLFQPGLQFNSKGGSMLGKVTRLNYVEMPLNMSLKIARGFIVGHQDLRVNAAPYAALNINDQAEVYTPVSYNIKKMDYGVKTGMSFSLGTLEPSFGYDFGLTNISNNAAQRISNRSFYMSVGLTVGK